MPRQNQPNTNQTQEEDSVIQVPREQRENEIKNMLESQYPGFNEWDSETQNQEIASVYNALEERHGNLTQLPMSKYTKFPSFLKDEIIQRAKRTQIKKNIRITYEEKFPGFTEWDPETQEGEIEFMNDVLETRYGNFNDYNPMELPGFIREGVRDRVVIQEILDEKLDRGNYFVDIRNDPTAWNRYILMGMKELGEGRTEQELEEIYSRQLWLTNACAVIRAGGEFEDLELTGQEEPEKITQSYAEKIEELQEKATGEKLEPEQRRKTLPDVLKKARALEPNPHSTDRLNYAFLNAWADVFERRRESKKFRKAAGVGLAGLILAGAIGAGGYLLSRVYPTQYDIETRKITSKLETSVTNLEEDIKEQSKEVKEIKVAITGDEKTLGLKQEIQGIRGDMSQLTKTQEEANQETRGYAEAAVTELTRQNQETRGYAEAAVTELTKNVSEVQEEVQEISQKIDSQNKPVEKTEESAEKQEIEPKPTITSTQSNKTRPETEPKNVEQPFSDYSSRYRYPKAEVSDFRSTSSRESERESDWELSSYYLNKGKFNADDSDIGPYNGAGLRLKKDLGNKLSAYGKFEVDRAEDTKNNGTSFAEL